MRTEMSILVVIFLILVPTVSCAELFEPLVVVYAGKMDYGEALVSIINQTGTRAVLAESDCVLKSLISLPQVRCVVIAAQNPSDFDFLRQFSPIMVRYFRQGGSLVGIGPCCGSDIEELSTTVFPVGGNATGKGRPIDGSFGSKYVLSKVLEPITGSLPSSFVVTQSEFVYRKGKEGALGPYSDLGETGVLYRDETTNAPMVVTLEGEDGGRTVSMPGCRVANVERLPFYWERLVDADEFKNLLQGSVTWAMEGCRRYGEMAESAEQDLEQEGERLQSVVEAGDELREKSRQNRIMLLAFLWSAAIVFQAFLVFKYIIPALRET